MIEQIEITDEEIQNDPLFWKMLFNFGRFLYEHGYKIGQQWRKNYSLYLQSQPWKEKARQARKNADNRCQICNSKSNLHVHHRTYERLGFEDQKDLIVLCSYCHFIFHERLKEGQHG